MPDSRYSSGLIPSAIRGAARWGALCTASALLPLLAGCPGAAEFCAGSVCDDQDLCTTDTCTLDGMAEAGFVCDNAPVDCGDLVCKSDDGTCVTCVVNGDCDDGTFCNGVETCDTNAESNTCVAGTTPCPDGEVCVEQRDKCAASCETHAECEDDGDLCTIEACTDGACLADERDCDDGLFCTGVELCDAADADADEHGCVSPGTPCADGDNCNETDDVCTEPTPCKADADCPDDEVYCNGTERCETDAGVCVSTGDPCADDEPCSYDPICNEQTDACDVPLEGSGLRLTPGAETVTAGYGDDFIDGELVVEGGVSSNTINDADVIDGGGCTDRLVIQTIGATTVTPASLLNIEVLDLEHMTGDALTFDLVNGDSFTKIISASAIDNGTVTVNNVATVLSHAGWINSAEAFTINIAASALSGPSDRCVVEINQVVDPGDDGTVFTIQPTAAGSGYETLTINSTGAVDNVVDQISDGVGTTLATFNVTGGARLSVTDALDASVTTVDAGTSTGGVALAITSTGVNTTCTGGFGDDTFDLSGAPGDYNINDTINGGPGTDSLKLDAADALTLTTQANVLGIEEIEVVTAGIGTVDITDFGATKFKSSGGALGGHQVTIPPGGTAEFGVDPAGNATIAPEPSNSSDTLTLIMDATWTGTCTLNGWETVNLQAHSVPVTFSSSVTMDATGAAEAIVITGTQAVTFTGATTCDVIDGSAMIGALTVSATGAVAQRITGGSANDTLNGSNANDTITGGDGTDIIVGHGGDDVLSGGAGPETFIFEATALANGHDVISDFTTSDILDVSAFVTADAPAGSVSDTATSDHVVADDEIWILTDDDGNIDTAAEVAALFGGGGRPFAAGAENMHVMLLIVDTRATESTRIWYLDDADSNTTVAEGECAQVGTLSNFNTPLVDGNIAD